MTRPKIIFAILLTCLCLTGLIAGSAKQDSPTPSDLDKNATGKDPRQLAQFVFDKYGCNSCHIPGKDGKFKFTQRGEQLRTKFEGCVNLLTAMNVMIHVPEAQWTLEEKQKHSHFQEYGCAFCHKIQPGRMGLTETGAKLSALHMSCPEVEQIISKPDQQ